jgi:hypothetical protein
MGAYTVFIGPITGIVTTDVSLRNPFSLVISKGFRILLRLSRLVLARTPHSCRRSFDVSASWKV